MSTEERIKSLEVIYKLEDSLCILKQSILNSLYSEIITISKNLNYKNFTVLKKEIPGALLIVHNSSTIARMYLLRSKSRQVCLVLRGISTFDDPIMFISFGDKIKVPWFLVLSDEERNYLLDLSRLVCNLLGKIPND